MLGEVAGNRGHHHGHEREHPRVVRHGLEGGDVEVAEALAEMEASAGILAGRCEGPVQQRFDVVGLLGAQC